MNILEIIQKHGLSIRQIPNEVTSCYSMHHHKEGNEIVCHTLSNSINYLPFKKKMNHRQDYVFDDDTQTVKRIFTKEVKIPNKAGYWMCKQVNNTSSQV